MKRQEKDIKYYEKQKGCVILNYLIDQAHRPNPVSYLNPGRDF